jgi:hypothetical protein
MKLPPACRNPHLIGYARKVGSLTLRPMQIGVNQPNRLCQEREQQGSGEKLRTAKPFASEKSAHKIGRSVLP